MADGISGRATSSPRSPLLTHDQTSMSGQRFFQRGCKLSGKVDSCSEPGPALDQLPLPWIMVHVFQGRDQIVATGFGRHGRGSGCGPDAACSPADAGERGGGAADAGA